MNLPYQLLALDVDGTLMNSRNELPEANRLALRRAHDAGLKISLCTGRSLTEARAVLDAIGLDLDAGIFVFGAIVSELPAGRTLARAPLPPELADSVLHFFQSRDFPVLILYDVAEAGVDYHLIPGRRNMEAYQAWARRSPTRVEQVDGWGPGSHLPLRIGVIDDPAHIDETMAELSSAFPPSALKFNAIYAPNYRLHVVECFAPHVNKWFGIQKLCDSLSIPGSQVVALGDDVNDVEMIARAGLGVAMGNAVEPVRAAARLQVAVNDDCGVAELIDRLLTGQVPAPRDER
ncbi:MAG TPA: HAD-IIB family hydrolase [Phycisphaerae bacterium]|nr:HAD-IIB family hydrolase [Phycisphaerae bacterium]HOB73179.1 HAD-IIB family hydrolase [Phycisphaerae bacterium]HOJ53350.1 HAD-IIB family hydrolase [Phycisphaerae bacterium]HOL27236.1 HAD-IIB family hydrolase [Phycisphaerae bacterium]HPP21796.1 HAD-IIB family hydrolase [Phycisphaerae bacterium]